MKWQQFLSSFTRVAVFFLSCCVMIFVLAGVPIGAHFLGKCFSYTTPVNCTVINEFDCYEKRLLLGGIVRKCYFNVDVFYGPANNRSARVAGPDGWPIVFSDVHTCYLNDADYSSYMVSLKYRDGVWKISLGMGIFFSIVGSVKMISSTFNQRASQSSLERITLLRARIDSRGARLHSYSAFNNL